MSSIIMKYIENDNKKENVVLPAARLTEKNVLTISKFLGQLDVLETRGPVDKFDKTPVSLKVRTVKGPRVLQVGDHLVRFPNNSVGPYALRSSDRTTYFEVVKHEDFKKRFTRV